MPLTLHESSPDFVAFTTALVPMEADEIDPEAPDVAFWGGEWTIAGYEDGRWTATRFTFSACADGKPQERPDPDGAPIWADTLTDALKAALHTERLIDHAGATPEEAIEATQAEM